jgi:hypothetical protein
VAANAPGGWINDLRQHIAKLTAKIELIAVHHGYTCADELLATILDQRNGTT